ncbi:toll/interleukin-1 receptor domain-containing protein [Amycolatopsis sp. NPDC051061]|uniref:toll/interleukin-1 receptor domain-containing protein n=1 Tax=Amycolatopsis sp. NPDC051061 TaxID=3155042 RepID=UPI0034452EB4
MSHVFLSYSRSDRRLLDQVRDDLRTSGVEVWSDRRLGLGGSWIAEISAAIGDARAVLLLATPAALASRWVMREVEAAQLLGKPIVPLLAEGSRFGDLPAGLAGINGVDLADGYEESMKVVVGAFANVEPASEGEKFPATLPVLLLLTAADTLAKVVTEVARSVGLAVVRPDPSAADVLEIAAGAHVMVIDGRLPVDCGFLAGYVAGKGGRVVCVTEPSGRGSRWTGVRFCGRDVVELEREICVAAFLPVLGRA